MSIVLAFVLSLWLYYKNKKNSETTLFVLRTLFALRFMSSALIILLLLNVFLKQILNETENPIILLAVDNSSSMLGAKDSAFMNHDFDAIIKKITKELGEKFIVKTMIFGSSTRVSEKFDFNDKETDFSNLILEIDNNYSNQNVGALIVASDGIYNKGANPLYPSEKLSFPIYCIATGDTLETKSLNIQKINHNELVYVGNTFPVEFIVNAKKLNGKTAKITVYKNNVLISMQRFNIASDNFSSAINFTLSADVPGISRYSAKLVLEDSVKSLREETRFFIIDVINNKEKILLLAAAPHPDLNAIREALTLSPNYDVESTYFSKLKKSVKGFNLVIFHGYSSENAQLLEECKREKIPFWIINPSTFAQIPGLNISNFNNKLNDSEPYYNATFGLFSLSAALEKFVSELPAVKTPFGNYELINSSNILLGQKLGSLETENPILFYSENDGLKNAVFIGDGLWKWKFRDYLEHKNNLLFNELVSKTIQYLAVKSDKSFFRINAPKIINENVPFEITAEVYNKSYELVTEPEVTLVLTNSENKKFNYTFSANEKSYKLNVGVLAPGEYRYEAAVKFENELILKQGLLAVNEIVAERLHTVANHQLLYQLANRSGGKLFYPFNTEQLTSEILQNEEIKPITYSQAATSLLIELKWLFWLILFLLMVEWFFRKRFLSI